MNTHALAGSQHCSCILLERRLGLAEPHTRALHQRRRHASGQCRAAKQQQSAPTSDKPDPGLGLKAVWYGAEQFGNVLGLTKRRQASKSEAAAPPKISRDTALASIRRDYDSNYFVSGVGDMEAYAPDCLFADPFAGFNGVERFKRNVSNLGGLMEDVQLELTGWEEAEAELRTRWRFSGVLQLPWRPRLAAAGGTTHVFSLDSGRVVKHIEAWDVDPGRVVRSLLRPAARMPTNRWEVLFNALDAGDGAGAWLAASPAVARGAAPVVAASLLCKLVTGGGLPGTFLGGLEGLAYLALAATAATKVVSLLRGVGGEAG